MSTISVVARPSRVSTKAASAGKRRSSARRDRVEAGIILAAFALAFAFFGTQQGSQGVSWSWTTVQTIPADHHLTLGAWTPLGAAADVSGEGTYRFCVTAQGIGTMLMNPTALMSPVHLTGTGPVTTCADTFRVTNVEALQPSATIADSASSVRILDASWQRLVTVVE